MSTRLTPRINAEELVKSNLIELERKIDSTRNLINEKKYEEAENYMAAIIQQSAGVEMWINTLKRINDNLNTTPTPTTETKKNG